MSQDGPARVRVSVFYTRSIAYSFEGLVLPPGITLAPGRPNIGKLLDGLVASMMSKGGVHGAFVGVCGPAGLGGGVARAVRTYNVDSKKAVGGIQFHEECAFLISRIMDFRLTHKPPCSLESLGGNRLGADLWTHSGHGFLFTL